MIGRYTDLETELNLARGPKQEPLSIEDRQAIRNWFEDPCIELWQEILWRIVSPALSVQEHSINIIDACKQISQQFASDCERAKREQQDSPMPTPKLLREALRYATH